MNAYTCVFNLKIYKDCNKLMSLARSILLISKRYTSSGGNITEGFIFKEAASIPLY